VDEKTYLSDDDVTITNTQVLIKGKAYTMSHITSVEAVKHKPKQLGPFIVMLVGVLVLIMGSTGDSGTLIAGVVILALGAVWAWIRRVKYIVQIESSSGRSAALVSSNKAYIEQVAAALQKAIVERG